MRSFFGMLGITIYIGLYAAMAATLGGLLVNMPKWIQLIYFAIAGVAWVLPLKPIMNWMKAEQKPNDP